MAAPVRILVLGASYGLLPGVKLALAGHEVTFVCRPEEIAAMARSDLEVRLPLRRSGEEITLRVPVQSRAAPGVAALCTPDRVDPPDHDFVILAMQEPQFKAPAVAGLMARIAASGRPCLSIMNLPPRSFLERLGTIPPEACTGVYRSEQVWQQFDPAKMSLASPDAQAIRLDPASPGHLTVTLPSNFKAAPFTDPDDQLLLERLAHDMSHLKFIAPHGGKSIRPPVMLLAQRSLFVPLAKWPMLIAGNCRCLAPGGIRTIAEAVLSDIEASRIIYEQVCQLALALGAAQQDLVAFADYCKAAERLSYPSSLARALAAGAQEVERIDLLVLQLMRFHHIASTEVEELVGAIQQRLDENRSAGTQ